MTLEQLTDKLATAREDNVYEGTLSGYAVRSIEKGRSSYPVSNLIEYCNGIGLSVAIVDMNTDEFYLVDGADEVHEAIGMLMKRYNVSVNQILRQTSVNYTAPKNGRTHLSVNTLLSVCSILHCRVDFIGR